MGRKIPAKKHRGVKDPLIQQARRLETLKLKINAPPKDPDEQPVPRSLTRLFAFQHKRNENEGVKKKQKIKKLNNKVGYNDSGVEYNPISRLCRLPGESGRDFSLRINSAVRALHNPVENLDYPQDIEKEDVKGERMVAQRERRARKRKQAKKGDINSDEPQLTRKQRFSLKKKEKKMKAVQASQEKQEVLYDQVSFGEVSHAPPALHFKNKKLQTDVNDGAPRPGRRDLLLTKLLQGDAASPRVGAAAAGMADAARRERARLDAVNAYRALKATKIKERNKLTL